VSIKLLQLTLQDANTKTRQDFLGFVPENCLVIYYEHVVTDSRYSFLKLTFASLALYMMNQ